MPSDPQNDSTTLIHNASTAASSSLVGNTINNRYFIEKEFSRGGFGIVYLARDLQLHSRNVVIKVLLDDAYQNDYVVQKFRQEVEALSRIDHPGVVGIIDAGELGDGKPYIVLQYVDGTTLRTEIRPEGTSFEMTAAIVKQIGRALTAAHEKGVLHRDLKPENVMLQDLGHGEQQVKVIDFGIARIKNSVVAPNTVSSIAAGTVSYMAPEQLLGRPASNATDVYALAEIAYEMLTGRKPFNPETGFDLLELQREGVRLKPVDLRPSLPTSAQDTILKGLSFDPESRQHSAREFGDELASTLEKKSTTSSTHSAEPEPTQLATVVTPNYRGVAEKTVAATFPVTNHDGLSDPSASPETRVSESRSKLVVISVGLLFLLVVAIGGFYFLYKRAGATQPTPVDATPTRSFNYWLTVQKMRDGHPYQSEFDSSGQEIFENGWKFLLNFRSSDNGYLYVLNEGPAENGATTYNLLFPAPSINSAASHVGANETIKSAWMRFDDNQGTEKFWLVWSSQPVAELESVRNVVNERDKGAIKDPTQAKQVREFLTAHYNSAKPQLEKDTNAKQTIVKSQDKVITTFVELEHH